MIDIWKFNSQLPKTSALPKSDHHLISQNVNIWSSTQNSFHKFNPFLPDTKIIPLTTNLQLKNKKGILYFPKNFGEIIIIGLIDTGALTCAISEACLRKIRLYAFQISNEGPTLCFQLMEANGRLETPSATVELHFEFEDIVSKERFIVMTIQTRPVNELLFL